MKYAVILKSDMPRWFDSLKKEADLCGPKKKENSFVFAPVDAFEEVSLFHIPTILPPKKYYFPPKEHLLKYTRKPFKTDKSLGVLPDLILFGVHTCDIAGIQCLDVIFSESPSDPYYLRRKEKITLIGIECLDYCDCYASCCAVGTHTPTAGFDIMLTDLGLKYLLHINSQKGELLIKGRKYIRPLDTQDRIVWDKVLEDKNKKFHNEFSAGLPEVSKVFDNGFFSPVWDDVGRRCVGCTNCTAVCPTCYCFDINDELSLDLNEGSRFRSWSYCQMDDFARVATGEDFRPGRNGRQKHRYFRKFKYSVLKYNKYFCTGCGRCTRTCMAKISLVETVNSLLDKNKDKS